MRRKKIEEELFSLVCLCGKVKRKKKDNVVKWQFYSYINIGSYSNYKYKFMWKISGNKSNQTNINKNKLFKKI